MERKVTKLMQRQQAAADLAYWLSRPVAERLAAVELLRQQALGTPPDHDAEPGLQRVCRVARRARG